ncbi:MAG: hypothetical protein ACOCY1_06125 [Halovenus sp.]
MSQRAQKQQSGGPSGRSPPHATTFRVPLGELGFDSSVVAHVDVDRRDGLRVQVRVDGAVYIFDQGWDRPRRRRDRGGDEPIDEVPQWLHAVLKHLGLERRVR